MGEQGYNRARLTACRSGSCILLLPICKHIAPLGQLPQLLEWKISNRNSVLCSQKLWCIQKKELTTWAAFCNHSSLFWFSWNSFSVAGDLLHLCPCMYALGMQLPSLLGFLLDHFRPSPATQLPHSSTTRPLTSALLLHPPPGDSDPLQCSRMDLVLLLSSGAVAGSCLQRQAVLCRLQVLLECFAKWYSPAVFVYHRWYQVFSPQCYKAVDRCKDWLDEPCRTARRVILIWSETEMLCLEKQRFWL